MVKEMAKLFKVNQKLLPIKLHYFFFLGGMGGVIPYIPLLGKGLGINATSIGLVFTVVPFCVLFVKPFFGFLTDYFQNIKIIVIILILVTTISYVCLLFIPYIDDSDKEPISVTVKSVDDNQLSLFPTGYNELCLKNSLKEIVYCELQYIDCDSNITMSVRGKLHEIKLLNLEAFEKNNSECIANVEQSRLYLPFHLEDNSTINCVKSGSSFLKETKSNITTCFCKKDAPTYFIYNTFQFWIFALLIILSGPASTTIYSLSDSACYEVLGDKPEHYGRQRLWGTASWGIVTLFAGFLNDLATGTDDKKDYSPGFYLMVTFVVIDLFILFKIQMSKAKFSMNICKDVGKVFSSCESIIFAFTVYVTGALSGLLWNYEFWYLEDLGANQSLLGLTVAVQCLVGEVPMFFFSGWFIKTFGYFNCVAASLTAFALRFGVYFLLKNPWLVLPIEILHGLTFGIFYASMTGYASTNAPSGTETTMLGIFGGLYEGLGVATGGLLGGIGFDKLGGRHTFLVAAIISMTCVPALLVSHFLTRKNSFKEENRSIKSDPKKRYDGEIVEHKM